MPKPTEILTRKQIPNIYYFDYLDENLINQTEGNAIFLIREGKKATIHFIKDKKIIPGEKMQLSEAGSKSFQDKKNENGQILLEDGDPDIQVIKTKMLYAHFPYQHAAIYLSKDNKSITLGHLSFPEKPIHPSLKQCCSSSSDLLKCLREIKESADGEQCINFYKVGGFPANAHWIGLDKMLDLVLQAKHSVYKTIFNRIKHISNQPSFGESLLTPDEKQTWDGLTAEKKEVLNHFRHFCDLHAENGISRGKLIETWVTDYRGTHEGKNPFDILKQHRQTNYLLSFFNPEKTSSIKLFEQLLGMERKPEVMNGDFISQSENIPT